jgi:hypothetical protein
MFQGKGIDDTDSHLAEVGDLAGDIGFGVLEREHHVRVFIGQFRLQGAPPAPAEILGGQRRAIGPAGIGANVEAVDEPVVAYFPAFSYAGHRTQRGRILRHQPLEQRFLDVVLGHAGGDVRIECLGFGAVAPMQDAGGIARIHPALTT